MMSMARCCFCGSPVDNDHGAVECRKRLKLAFDASQDEIARLNSIVAAMTEFRFGDYLVEQDPDPSAGWDAFHIRGGPVQVFLTKRAAIEYAMRKMKEKSDG